MTSVQLRYNCLRTGSNGPSQVRIVILYDKQPTGALPVALDVFASDTSVSPLNLSNSDRFLVLMDEMSDSMQSTGLNISGSRYRKIDLQSTWPQGSSSGIANIKTGAVYLMLANNDAVTGTVSNNVDIFTRIRFTDL